MITPLEIENKKFSKQMMNGYSVDEVDDFLDDLTVCYEKLYKESNEHQTKIEELEASLKHYKSIEETLNNTLIMAQSTAEDIKNVAKQQADQIVKDAEAGARQSLATLEQQVVLKQKLEENTEIPITIPDFGETYEIDKDIEMVGKTEDKARERYLRLEVLERMNTLKEELEDMSTIVKEEYLQKNATDADIVRIKERLKELESQIVRIVENK